MVGKIRICEQQRGVGVLVVCAGVRDKAHIGAAEGQWGVNRALRLVRTSTICWRSSIWDIMSPNSSKSLRMALWVAICCWESAAALVSRSLVTHVNVMIVG